MKPYSYDGTCYSNMDEVFKWAESSRRGPRRRPTRHASAAAAMARRVTNKRARNAAKRACAMNEVL